MECTVASQQLAVYLSGDLSMRDKRKLFAHLEHCTACSREKEELEKLWRELGTLPQREVPETIRTATLLQIEGRVRREPQRSRLSLGLATWVQKPLTAVFAAIAVASLSLWVLRDVTAFSQLSDEVIFLCSALWTGMLGLSFLFATGAVPSLNPTWQRPARIALSGFGFALVTIALCPKMSLIEWWESLTLGEFLLRFGPTISHGAFGALYAFIPFFLAVCFFGRKLKGNLFSQLLGAGILFLILLFPGILLQALPLSYFVVLSWALGSALGVMMAALSGAGLFRRDSLAHP